MQRFQLTPSTTARSAPHLARSGRAHEREELAGLRIAGDASEDLQAAGLVPHLAELEQWHGGM